MESMELYTYLGTINYRVCHIAPASNFTFILGICISNDLCGVAEQKKSSA